MFNLGVLYRAQQFLDLVSSGKVSTGEFRQFYPNFHQISSAHILDLAQALSWIRVSETIELSTSGLTILKEDGPVRRLRRQLRDVLLFQPPSWAGLLPRGRKALLHFGGMDTIQCFQAAELLTEADPEVAAWWDDVSRPFFELSHASRIETGRRGEWLTIQREEARVSVRPEWTSLDNPLAPYDVLSVVQRNSDDKLFIEVKTSQAAWDEASFFLSRSEWNFLSSRMNTLLHLWSVARDSPVLAIVNLPQLGGHIPLDQGEGEWQNVEVPFRVFPTDSPL
jgi:hypothetical protein